MNFIHSTLDALRDRYAPVTHTSTVTHTSNFRSTGQITPEEFIAAGDFLVYKFPSWSWSDASSPARRVAYLPPDKQFLITRGVPCHRRLDENYVGEAGAEDRVVRSDGEGEAAGGGDEEEGWLQTGGATEKEQARQLGEVRTLDASGNMGDATEDEEDEIPDMEDEEDDDAIIRDHDTSGTKIPLRTYTLYITYTPYYRTPRLYLSGYLSASEPLPPPAMMEDIMGDYKDKTVTLEDFPFFDPSHSIKMASVHPCRHASVMKVLLDRADAALRLRKERLAKTGGPGAAGQGQARKPELGMEGLVEETKAMSISAQPASDKQAYKAGVAAAGGSAGDEWEVLQHDAEAGNTDESAIRVDQYLVVFLKFISSVTPTIEHDFTMGV